QIRALGLALALALEHGREGVVSMGSPGLVATLLAGLLAQAVGLGVESVEQGDADLGKEPAPELDHAQVVHEAVHVADRALLGPQLVGVGGLLALGASLLLEPAQTFAPSRAQQFLLRARALG